MEMQWEKVPERLHSESLKCLFCHAMARTLQRTGNFKASWTLCCSLMVVALTMDDDEAFESKAKLMQALRSNMVFHDPLRKEETAFLHQYKEYFVECTSRVLKAVKNCPDKSHNRRRS